MRGKSVDHVLEINPKSLFTRLLDASVDGIFAFDRDCRIIAWNRAMQRISGLTSDEALGKRVVDIFPFLRESGSDDSQRQGDALPRQGQQALPNL